MVVYVSITLLIATIAALFVGVATSRHGYALLGFVIVCSGFGLPPLLNHISKQDEIDAARYYTLYRMQRADAKLTPAISMAMKDHQIDGLEYDRLTEAYEKDMLERSRGKLSLKAIAPTPDELRREARYLLSQQTLESEDETRIQDKEDAK